MSTELETTGPSVINLSDAKELVDAPNYFIFSNGNLWSQKSKKFLKSTRGGHRGNYRKYALYVDKKYKLKYVHRLVMEYFGPPMPRSKAEVNHIDGDTSNNNLENLEWVSSSENTRHGISTNLFSRVILTTNQVKEIKTKFKTEPEYYGKVADIARMYGVSYQVISQIKHGRNWKYIN